MEAFDPTTVDVDGLQQDIETVDSLNERQEVELKLDEQKKLEEQQAQQEKENQPKGFVNELSSAVLGGAVDTVNDITSIPERVVDLASGEMAEEGSNYKPTWMQIDEDPFETTTWWGGLIRGVINYGSLFVTGGFALKGASAGLKGLGLALKAPSMAPVVTGALKGAAVDAVALQSMDENVSAQIIKHMPAAEAVLGPLATKDTDHPMTKTIKNIVEGLGLGFIADVLILRGNAFKTPKEQLALPPSAQLALPPGVDIPNRDLTLPALPPAGEVSIDSKGRYVVNQGSNSDLRNLLEQKRELEKRLKGTKSRNRQANLKSSIAEIEAQIQDAASKDLDVQVAQRNKSVENQTIEIAKDDMAKGDGFSPYVNKPIAERHEGNALSGNKPSKVMKQLNQIDTDPSAAKGSTDSMVTPMQARRAAQTGGSEKLVQETIKEMVSEAEYQNLMKQARQKNIPFEKMYELNVRRFKETVDGRMGDPDMELDEFMDPLTSKYGSTGGDLDIKYFPRSELLAVDLLVVSLTKQARDLAMGARELDGIKVVTDPGGLLEATKERLTAAVIIGRRSRYLWGLEGKQMGGLGDMAPDVVADNLKRVEEESIGAANLLMKMIDEDVSGDLLKAYTEIISGSTGLKTLDDLDAHMRKIWRGGGDKDVGALIKELQAVAINSTLSGPKTPARALIGNTINTYSRFFSQALGAMTPFAGDATTRAASAASLATAFESIPEAWKLFTRNLGSYMKNDVATIKTRFSRYTLADQQWEATKHWAETRGTLADKAAVRVMNIARGLNNNSFLTYSTRIMAATDDAFKYIMARARSKELVIRDVIEKGGDLSDKKVLRQMEDSMMAKYTDAEGNFDLDKDQFIKDAYLEATLQTDLEGHTKAFASALENNPWLKPFVLFAKTGINGLAMTAKNTPIINLAVAKERAILMATEETLDSVRRYGINSVADLNNAKALQAGRQTIGSAVVMAATGWYLTGNITGNGPADRQKRKLWIDSGWQPRSIRMPGGVWVTYDAFEPFNTILAAVADVGDHQELMGDEWAEQGLTGAAFLVGGSAVNKSFLAGLNMLIEATQGGISGERVLANIVNNQLPLSSLRNELGKIINPGMKELNGSFWESINNRNLYLDPSDLPEKYDILTGEPIRGWHPLTRAFNAISPIQFNMDDRPGLNFLTNSNYDMVASTYSIPSAFGGGTLQDFPQARSLIQRYMGEQNLEEKLVELSQRESVKQSMAEMERDRQTPDGKKTDPMSYHHNILIKSLMESARNKAWARAMSDPAVKEAIIAEKESKMRDVTNTRETSAIQEILTIHK